jgi:hypothetical protein
LGASSLQFDQAGRGFSFACDGPLDMRMDPARERTAAEIVNRWDESDLADLFYHEGGEGGARKVARAIVEARARAPFLRTLGLAELVEHALGGRRGRVHPATKVFQALRRAVNEEGDELQAALAVALYFGRGSRGQALRGRGRARGPLAAPDPQTAGCLARGVAGEPARALGTPARRAAPPLRRPAARARSRGRPMSAVAPARSSSGEARPAVLAMCCLWLGLLTLEVAARNHVDALELHERQRALTARLAQNQRLSFKSEQHVPGRIDTDAGLSAPAPNQRKVATGAGSQSKPKSAHTAPAKPPSRNGGPRSRAGRGGSGVL